MKVKSESEVVQSCPTFSNPMDSSLLGSSIHGIFQARVLEWGTIALPVPAMKKYNLKWKTQYHWQQHSKQILKYKLAKYVQNEENYKIQMKEVNNN